MVLTENGIRVTSPDGTVTEVNASGDRLSTATTAVRGALGEPTASVPSAGGVCDFSTYSWDGFFLTAYTDSGGFYASVGDNGNERVATERGTKVGDPISAFIAANPDARAVEAFYGGTVYFIDTDASGTGVVIGAKGEVVESIAAALPDPSEDPGDC